MATTGFGIAVNGVNKLDYGITLSSKWTAVGEFNVAGLVSSQYMVASNTSFIGFSSRGGLYASADGAFNLRDNAGTINTGSLTLTNLNTIGFVSGIEIAAPAAPAADGFRIFAQDNGGGKTQLMVIFSSGAAQQIAIQP